MRLSPAASYWQEQAKSKSRKEEALGKVPSVILTITLTGPNSSLSSYRLDALNTHKADQRYQYSFVDETYTPQFALLHCTRQLKTGDDRHLGPGTTFYLYILRPATLASFFSLFCETYQRASFERTTRGYQLFTPKQRPVSCCRPFHTPHPLCGISPCQS